MLPQTVTTDPFVKISNKDVGELLKVLKERLPKSAHEYNMVLLTTLNPRHGISIYTLHGKLSSDAIVLLMDFRKDYGQDISMSVPFNFSPHETFKDAMLTTKWIDWNGPYYFTSIDTRITPVILQVCTTIRKTIFYYPNYEYVFDTNEALQLDFSNIENNIEFRPLDKISGAKFLVDNWKYTRDGTMDYTQKMLETQPNVGIFVDGKLACGGLVNTHGLIGQLYTDPNYRRLGLAQLLMRYLFKEMAKIGLVPCSSAQVENMKSCVFHEKVGMTLTHGTDYLRHLVYSET